MPCLFFSVRIGVCSLRCVGRVLVACGGWEMRTMVMATVLALVAGGFRIVTRPMERMIARTIRLICVMWTRNFQDSSKERIEDSSCIFAVGGRGSRICCRENAVGDC